MSLLMFLPTAYHGSGTCPALMVNLVRLIHLTSEASDGLDSYRVTPLYRVYSSALQERLSGLHLLVRTI